MGEHADEEMSKAMIEMAYHERSLNNYIWTQGDGSEIKVKDMTSSHIQNSIKCLKNGKITFYDGQITNNWLEIFTDELKKR